MRLFSRSLAKISWSRPRAEALEYLLKNEVAVILVDVCMPELDGFELAAMIREHPRFQKTAMIFISAIQVSDYRPASRLRMGAVDYVPVPVIPEVLRAKIRCSPNFTARPGSWSDSMPSLRIAFEPHRGAGAIPREASGKRETAQPGDRRGRMGSWDWDWINGDWMWDEGQYRIFGVDPKGFVATPASVQACSILTMSTNCERPSPSFAKGVTSYEAEFRSNGRTAISRMVRRHRRGNGRQRRPCGGGQRRHH